MSSIFITGSMEGLSQDNITTRRSNSRSKVKMMATDMTDHELEYNSSLLIEHILSHDEVADVIKMMDMADELGDVYTLPSFITSTQMNGRDPRRRPDSPPLSPVSPRALITHGLTNGCADCPEPDRSVGIFPSRPPSSQGEMGMNQFDAVNQEIYGLLASDSLESNEVSGNLGSSRARMNQGLEADPDTSAVIDPAESCASDPLTLAIRDVSIKTITSAVGGAAATHRRDGDMSTHTGTLAEVSVERNGEVGVSVEQGRAGSLSQQVYEVDVAAGLDTREEETDGEGEATADDEAGQESGEENYGEGVEVHVTGDQAQLITEMADPTIVAAKMKLMEGMLALLDGKSTRLEDTVRSLEDSLEYAYKEITDLKKENGDMRLLMGSLELEDKRTQFQITDVADKLDRLDSVTRKRNLLFEGIPESVGKREDVDAVICDVFDQLSVNEGINFEACYRFGPVSKTKPRPILVAFERQADRDMIYAKRTELRFSRDFSKVWINEDVSPASRRRRDLIRLISREAQQQGVDCRTGKYAVHIDKKKYDGNNLDELPPQLHPGNLKQVLIDQNTLAYQSEHAPLSNFYPCQIIIGKHKFFCAEQAFQFLRAKLLNKPLAATRIYLSRDVRFIKQQGQELGTSEKWNTQQFDYMYICLKQKFEQNPKLKALLLDTGNMELVEATPDRLWGCGATLSSNVLKQHNWPGSNKHGKILMTLREELRSGMPV